MGAARWQLHKGYNTFLSDNNYLDKDVKNSLFNLNVVLNEGHNISMLNNADLIVKSPGVPSDIPFLLEAKKQSIQIISEIEFGYMFTNLI